MKIDFAGRLDRPILRYVWAIVVVAAAFLLRYAIVQLLGQQLAPTVPFALAVLLVALLVDFWPGVFATVVSAAVIYIAILAPAGQDSHHGLADAVSLALFIGTSLVICLVARQYRSSQRKVAESAKELALRDTQEKLAESEINFKRMANSIPQLCWTADPDGWITWYNDRWFSYTGTTLEQMQGWGWQSVHDPTTLPKVTEQWNASIATGSPFEMVLPLRSKDGEFRLFLTRGLPLKDKHGKVVRWFGTNTDINEQKQIEAELRSTNQRLDMALEAAGLGEWDLNFKTHVATRSLRHCQIFGYESVPSSWSSEMFVQHVLPEHRAEVSEKVAASYLSGSLEFETRMRRADGEIRWIWVRGRHVPDENGDPARMYGTVMDITDRKQAETALKNSEAQLQLFVEHTPAAVAMFDKDMRYLVLTRRWQNDYQLGDGDLRGVSHYDVLPWTREARGELHRRAIGGEVIVNEAEPFILKDGTSIWLRWEMRPWFDLDGSIGGMLMFTEDITDRKRSDDLLKDSEAQLRLFVEQAPVPLAMFDRDMRYIVASHCWTRDYGLSGRDISGLSHYETFPEMPDHWRDSHARGLAGEVVKRDDDLIQKPDGTSQWMSWEVLPWRDAAGEIGGILIFSEDIAERKRTEKRLRQLTRTYAVLSDINQTVVRQKDSKLILEAACDIAVNKGLFRMAWVGLIDPTTRKVLPVANSGNYDGLWETVKINVDPELSQNGPTTRCLRSGEHSVCNDIENDPNYAPWRDEAMMRGYRSSAGFPINVQGEVIGVFSLYSVEPGFFNDQELVVLDEMALVISYALEVNRHEAERRKIEDELRWRTAFFEAQLESSPDGILVTDNHGDVMYKNHQFVQMWNMPEDLFSIGKGQQRLAFAVLKVKSPSDYADSTNKIFANSDWAGQEEVELLDGTFLTRFTSPVNDASGKHYGRVWVFQDITRRRQMEQQLRQSQKMEAVGQLTGGIAHDFNNLLGVILGNLDLLHARVEGDEASLRRVQTAQKAAERGADVTRRLLAFSRSGELKPVPTRLHLSVRDVVELARTLGPDIKFVTHLDDSVSPVFVDAAGLENALLNLVVNSRDAMPNGGTVTIATEVRTLDLTYPLVEIGELTASTAYACISVTDTGFGMSKQTLDRVFEPFFTTKSEGKGTGLGLAMVYGFVKQSGGAVRIYSEEGVGTTATIYLPLSDEIEVRPANVDAAPARTSRPTKVLVVDDEPDLVEITRIYLERMGFEVYEANDAETALDIARGHQDIDLMITDIIMPGGVNGVELAYSIRELLPHIKIIYSSGFPANAMASRGLPRVDGLMLRKPYHLGEFEAAIRIAMD